MHRRGSTLVATCPTALVHRRPHVPSISAIVDTGPLRVCIVGFAAPCTSVSQRREDETHNARSPPEIRGQHTMAHTVTLIDITRDRPANPAFQALAGSLAEGARRVASERYETTVLYADEWDAAQLIEQTEGASALVFLGGEDVDPMFYDGSADYPGSGTHHTLADERQIELIQHHARLGTPILGICRGAQMLNVALGGTLVQHLEVPGHRNPNILNDLTLATHTVEIDEDSRVGRAMRADDTARAADGTVTVAVQSAHHQAIDRPGEGLRIVGRSADGVVEAVEHVSAPIAGVQWHPEDPNTSGAQVTFLLETLVAPERTSSLE